MSTSLAPRRSKLYIACSDFLQKSERAHAATPPFRKKSCSAHLLGCKRPRDVSLSLPTSCGFKSSSAFYAGGFFIKSAATHIPLRLLSKSKPLRWVVILFLRRTAAIRRHTPSLAPPFGKKSRYAYAVRW